MPLATGCALLLACETVASITPPDLDAGALDVLDAAGLDVADLDAPSDAEDVAPDGDAPTDAGCDASCPLDESCLVYLGCDCVPTALADDTSCGTHGETCQSEACTPPPPGCGSLWRDLTPAREGCDDGNLEDGDACSSTCTPSLLMLASPLGGTTASVTMASDGTGRVLFAWVESAGPDEMGERTLSVRAAIYSAPGVVEVEPFDLETGLGVGQPVAPSVAGLEVGWAVAWRSTFIEGSDADLGGIAYAVIDHDADPIRLRQANTEERFDQREPAVTPTSDGFAIAWTDGSDRSADPGLGIRTRPFHADGLPNGKVTGLSLTLGDQSQPALASLGAGPVLAFTDRSGDMPVVHLYRPSDTDPVALTDLWSFSPVVSAADGSLWTAWLAQPSSMMSPASDAMGGVHVRAVAPTGAVDVESDLLYGSPSREDAVTIVARDAIRAVVGWHTDAAPQGLRIAAIGWTFPPEAAALELLLAGHRERDLRMLATYDGLWLAWVTESDPEAESSLAAYLLPWD